MDYKKIIHSRKRRQKLLEMLAWVPDIIILKLQYWIKTGRKLHLDNPQRYTEKLQWYKLYYRDPRMIKCVDKFDVREYVKEKGLCHILNKCYGVFSCVEDIDYDSLPNSFVIKDTLGVGGNSIIICKNKEKFDFQDAKVIMNEWLNTKIIKSGGREWPYYSGKKHRILIEEYIETKNNALGLVDYKFFCFNGEVYCLYVIAARNFGKGAQLGIYSREYKKTKNLRVDEFPLVLNVPKPKNYEEMIKISKKLSEKFPHARIDLYNIEGEIRFGEITFWDGSGYMTFSPDAFDFVLGNKFILPNDS